MDFPYVFLLQGGLKQKKQLIKRSDVKIDSSIETHISIFQYGEDAMEYYRINNTLKGYRGLMSADILPFDIDADNLEDAIEEERKLLTDLKRNGITQFKLHFSGKKGFHTIVPSAWFDRFEPSATLPEQLLSLAKSITSSEFDRSLYSHLKPIRVTNTYRLNIKRYKIPITEDDLKVEVLLEKSKQAQKLIKLPEVRPIKTLIDLKEKVFSYVPKEFNVEINYERKLCVQRLYEDPKVHERNESLCILTAELKQKGMPYGVAYSSLYAWGRRIGLQEDEFKETFRSIWEGRYSYGCWYWLSDKYCNENCYLYSEKFRNKKEDAITFYTLQDARQEYDDFLKNNKRVELGIHSEIDKKIRGCSPGDLFAILGRPTCYKSTLAQMIGTYFCENYFGYFLIVSLEMSLTRLYERHLQVLSNQSLDAIEKSHQKFNLSQNLDRFLMSTKKGLSPQQVEKAVKEWQQKTGHKIEMIIIDFLHALRTDGDDNKVQISNSMALLKELPHNLNTRLGILVHTKRQGEGDEFKPVYLSSGRDSSAIEDNVDFLLGAHKIKDDPSILIVQLLKNKNGNTKTSGYKMKRSDKSVCLEELKGDYLPMEEQE